jgi:hypothetical protein
MSRGARGLLAASTGVGVSLSPTDDHTLRLVVLIAGDYGDGEDLTKAKEILRASYHDLATADLGHLLGLHEPVVDPVAIAVPFGLGLGVELDPDKLFRGLSAATIDDIEEIMK